ncbi:MAG: DNA primase DnaG [Thermoproteota archaeon]|nr:DNA primase DnaG [Thermoproteota archaeon]
MKLTRSSRTVTVKYVIRAEFEIDGVVEKSDVVGAVFGQTEGLFGPELDLRELQRSGRVGRIEIELKSERDKTTGSILIPTSLDRVSTAILAASLESIDRVGPCASKIVLKNVQDIRDARRRSIVERAKEILHDWTVETLPTTDEIFKEVAKTLELAKTTKYGPEELTAGPGIQSAKEIIIVEGRADVINLLKCGIPNVIALEGAKIPESIIELCRGKKATALLDGDRGGDLILKELLQVTNVKYVTRAPHGKEVEDLNCIEVFTALKNKTPAKKVEVKKKRLKPAFSKRISGVAKKLEGTLEAVLLDEKMKQIKRLPVSELAGKLQKIEGVNTVVFDGVITKRVVDIARKKDIQRLVAARVSGAVRKSKDVNLLTFSDIKN